MQNECHINLQLDVDGVPFPVHLQLLHAILITASGLNFKVKPLFNKLDQHLVNLLPPSMTISRLVALRSISIRVLPRLPSAVPLLAVCTATRELRR